MEKYGFFSSINDDRVYTAADFTSYFSKFLQNGYFPDDKAFVVEANGTLELKVNPGTMWINGHVYELTDKKTLTVEVESNLSRKDRIVVRLDYVNRKIETVIKKGIASEKPSFPALQRDNDAYEMCIAEYLIGPGITAMQQSYIIDKRNSIYLCGEVTSIIDKHTLKDFCNVSGFTMNGAINTKDLLPVGEANIGSETNRYQKIYCKDIDVENGLNYVPLSGGTMKGYLYTQMLIPTATNSYDLGTSSRVFGRAHIKDLYVYGNSPFVKRDGDTVEGSIKFNDLNANSLKIGDKRLYIQSTPPIDAKEGDVWIEC